jgi:hypothetical protein
MWAKENRMPRPKPRAFAGPVRPRHDPPTLEEAVFAAQGLSDEPEQQSEIAALLIGVPESEVKPIVLRMAASPRAQAPREVLFDHSGRRAVVVERKARILVSRRKA